MSEVFRSDLVEQLRQDPVKDVHDLEVACDARSRAEFVLLDGTLAECDRAGRVRQGRRRPGRLLLQTPAPRREREVVTDPCGQLLWLSPALPGRTQDLTAARTHRIIRICEPQGVPILADLAYQGAGPWLTTGIKRRPLQELTPTEKSRNQALVAARAPVERGVAS